MRTPLLSLMLLSSTVPLVLHAQNWTVGVPVDLLITSNTFVGGCAPEADATFTFAASSAQGVDHVAYITAIDPPSGNVTILPGISGGEVGDSVVIAASVQRSVTCAAGTNNVTIEFRAVGTPTQAGDVHPCGGPSNWISNLMLCPEGLFPSFNLNCTVQAGNTGIAEISSAASLILPTTDNGALLRLVDDRSVAFAIHDLGGRTVITGTTELANGVYLSGITTGCYVLHAVLANGRTLNERFWLAP